MEIKIAKTNATGKVKEAQDALEAAIEKKTLKSQLKTKIIKQC